ncbi:hypothetical protein [Nonomuraea candida]|uniref:hypothetical protein n=1 Tax=Nonomuraea candida TaxID=359159 RepID=UPI0006938B5A|nr:hypothetical protein [Nonomuraea candida]
MAGHDRERGETRPADLLSALVVSEEGARAVEHAVPAVFPWTRHLSEGERREFVQDLVHATRDVVDLDVHATRDVADLDVHATLHRVIVEWRATARILADPALTATLTRALPDEDHGEVPAP